MTIQRRVFLTTAAAVLLPLLAIPAVSADEPALEGDLQVQPASLKLDHRRRPHSRSRS